MPTYDEFADDYDRFVNWTERLTFELPLIESMLQELPGPAPLRILDAACGTGSTFLAPQLSSQLQSALESEHFTEIRAFGSFSGEPFQPEHSGNLVLSCRTGLLQ